MEQSISGYWRLMKDGEVIYDDSACEELNEDKETAEDFFEEYLKENMKAHDVDYANYNVKVIEDSKYFHIDFRTGMGKLIIRRRTGRWRTHLKTRRSYN